jgi:hypothetical protein
VRSALGDYAGHKCPEEDVQIRETRRVGDDTVYLADACGSVVEVEHGFSLPHRRSELTELGPESPLELPPRVKRVVPREVTEIMRHKVQRWCLLGTPEGQDPELVAFYSATSAQQAECRARLAQSLAPLGTELDLQTNSNIYWFALGHYVFTTTEALYEPPPEHRSAEAAPSPTESPNSNAPVPVRRGAPGEARAAKQDLSHGYARVELGLGYLNNATPGRIYDGVSWDTRAEGGLKLSRGIGLGAALTTRIGLGARYREDQPYLLDTALSSTFYPGADAPFNFGAQFGVTALTYDYTKDLEIGPSFGANLGFDFGERGKSRTAWTGAGLHLRGHFALIDGHWVRGGALYLGTYHW